MLDGISLTPSLFGGSVQNAQATQGSEDEQAAQIKQLGQDFEGVFLSLLLKEMRKTVDGGLFAEDSSDSLGGIFDLFLGEHLAETTPIGVADLMIQSYESQNQNTGKTPEAMERKIDLKG